ncbi:hypothetical protein Pint_30379 [Pistacia integerrima]|uniref:Uncharacterized protein n=1 Tax=Pistacia integerrima TaxID=434235 RepID=A0ACC0WY58_9ROSI|nr:hypothetical protein Pint_30379 [Pistacia integerrima]
MDLGNYGFQGSLVPQLGSLANLQYLEIYSNQINGSIPADLRNLTNSLSLDLYENQLSGPIPDSLGNLKALLFMRLNNNKLTGTVPQSVKALTNGNLRILDIAARQQVPANQNSGVQGYNFSPGNTVSIGFDLDILPSGFFFGPFIKETVLTEMFVHRRRVSKVLLKRMSNGFGSGQAFMLWKRLYGNDIWAHCIDGMEGVKILFTLDYGLVIETVIIPCDRGRRPSVFQVRMALKRHLTTTEIVEQAGMGEPLHNVGNVIKASDITVHEQGLHFSPHKVTVSTSGCVPQLKRFLHESNCALAVSLNATTDEVRNWIMLINWKYKLGLSSV